jgi:hypothetical protein
MKKDLSRPVSEQTQGVLNDLGSASFWEDFTGNALMLLAAKKLPAANTGKFASMATSTQSRGFSSFSAFKRAMGNAGEGKAWHHIVEQTPSNVVKFGAENIHNTNNLMKLPHGKASIHAKISGYYSSKQFFTGGKTVREWLSTQSYEYQYNFGIQKLKEFGWKEP